jgi:hypothetical protein
MPPGANKANGTAQATPGPGFRKGGGSDHDGEVLTAGRMARALLRDAGKTWPELLRLSSAQPMLPVWRKPRCKNDVLDLFADWTHVLTQWERRFILSVASRLRLSPTQLAVIERILDKIRYAARCAAAPERASHEPL